MGRKLETFCYIGVVSFAILLFLASVFDRIGIVGFGSPGVVTLFVVGGSVLIAGFGSGVIT